jgi:D-alanyl-lipoteichoic acid acyltransferase DltB (MBOAT superfamily)
MSDPIPFRMSEVPADPIPLAKHGVDIVSLIFGVLALACALASFIHGLRLLLILPGLLLVLVALISGHTALNRLNVERGFAIAGLILGYIAVAVLLVPLLGAVVGRVFLRRRIFRRLFSHI